MSINNSRDFPRLVRTSSAIQEKAKLVGTASPVPGGGIRTSEPVRLGSSLNPRVHPKLAARKLLVFERLIGWLHRTRPIVTHQSPVKVNLGSGLYVAPGWINIDASLKALLKGWPVRVLRSVYPLFANDDISVEAFVRILREHNFVHQDLKYGIPLRNSTADFIFTSHMLHHLYRDQAVKLLREILRVLKPGGTLRIVVPDLEFIVALYQDGQRERALEYFFYPTSRSALFSRRYQYDFVLLARLLESIGFDDIRRCSYREGRTPDLSILDRLPNESLFVEAQRPLIDSCVILES